MPVVAARPLPRIHKPHTLMRTILLVSFALALVVSISKTQAQSTFTIPLFVTNNNGAIDTLRFGLDPEATYGIDDALGEFEYPPFPPTSVFEARFVNVTGHPTEAPAGLGEGVKTDIRRYVQSDQRDTFRIKFQPGDNGFPVTISWPDGIGETSGEMTIRSAGTTMDMRTVGSLTINDPDVSVATIVRNGDPATGVDHGDAMENEMRLSVTPSVAHSIETILIEFRAPEGSVVAVEVYNALGDLVARATPDASSGHIPLDTRRLVSGRYFVLLQRGLSSARSSFVVVE